MGLGRVMRTRAGEEGSLVPSRHDEQGGNHGGGSWPTAPAEALKATPISSTALGNQMPLIPRDIELGVG